MFKTYKKYTFIALLATVISLGLVGINLVAAPQTYAQARCPSGLPAPDNDPANCPPSTPSQSPSDSSGQETLDSDCEVDTEAGESLTPENCKIIEYLVTGINVLSALAGMAIVASIMIGGYQYMTARDNPGQIQQARMRIVWALVALLLFIFMYALLNFLVPGGVL